MQSQRSNSNDLFVLASDRPVFFANHDVELCPMATPAPGHAEPLPTYQDVMQGVKTPRTKDHPLTNSLQGPSRLSRAFAAPVRSFTQDAPFTGTRLRNVELGNSLGRESRSAASYIASLATICCVWGAASGSIGNEVYHSLNPNGHTALAAQHASVGGAVLGAGLGAITYLAMKVGQDDDCCAFFAAGVLTIGAVCLSGVPGAAILHAARAPDDLSISQSGIASSIGTVVTFPGALFLLGCVAGMIEIRDRRAWERESLD